MILVALLRPPVASLGGSCASQGSPSPLRPLPFWGGRRGATFPLIFSNVLDDTPNKRWC